MIAERAGASSPFKRCIQMTRRLASALAIGVPLAQGQTLPAAPAPAAEPVPIESFFAPPSMSQPVLSPDGQHLALRMASKEGRIQLAVLNLAPPRQLRVVAGFHDADVREAQWVNNDRLVFTIDDFQAAWRDRESPGLFAVDRTADGSPEAVRLLIQRDHGPMFRRPSEAGRQMPAYFQFLRTLRDGSDDVLVRNPARARLGRAEEILRQNTRTGRTHTIDTGPALPDAMQWWVDAHGRARWATTRREDVLRWHWRETPDGLWREVLAPQRLVGDAAGIDWVEQGADGHLYLAMPRPGDPDQAAALYRLDAATGQPERQPVVALQGLDFRGALVFDGRTRRLLGVHYLAEAPGSTWLDPEMARLQARIDQRLPGLVNHLQLPECRCTRWWVVTSQSPTQPPVHWLYDSEADQLEPLGRSRPRIDARQMRPTEFTRIAARDGLGLPLYLTRPAGTGPWPTVMLVHGGPFVRGRSLAWDGPAQFLASRGYLVVEPEFRGSTGYGQRLLRAGFKQWGLAMQDDIADVARWAIDKGLADKSRLCILGSSYGGYSALMGLARDGDLYRCGVASMAVSDLDLMYTSNDSDLGELALRYALPVLLGDRLADAEQLKATSPVHLAGRIRAPLLLSHGAKDRRVPIEHGRRMRDALQAAKAPVQWVEYADEGHGFLKPANLIDHWSRVERFLGAELAAQPKGSTP